VSSHFPHAMRAFARFWLSLYLSPAIEKPDFAPRSLHRKFPFPAQAETGSMNGWSVPSLSPIIATAPESPFLATPSADAQVVGSRAAKDSQRCS
jgi:hypothetical protein